MRSRRAERCVLLLIPLLLLVSCREERAAIPAALSAPVPHRIIALTPSVVETLFALGLGDRVVGVGNYVTWPPEAVGRPRIGGLFDPNLERIVSLKPDLAVLITSERDLATQLKPLGVDFLVVPDDTLADVEGSFLAIARRCGVPEAGRRLTAQWQAGLVQRHLSGPPPRVMISVGRTAGRLGEVTVAARQTFYDELLARLGAANVFADAPTRYPQVGLEEIVARKPDVVLEVRSDRLTPEQKAAIVRDWSALPQIPAVHNGRVLVIAGDFTMLPGPRLPLLYREMREALDEPSPPRPSSPAPSQPTTPGEEGEQLKESVVKAPSLPVRWAGRGRERGDWGSEGP